MSENTTPTRAAGNDNLIRAATAARAREEIVESAAVLLGEVHDIDFHNYADGPTSWLNDQPIHLLADGVLHLADRLATAAETARAAVHGALARRDWLTEGRPLRCINCDDPIDTSWDEWQVCRGMAEHTACHHDDPAAEDTDRRYTLTEAEHHAYHEDRARTGGPREGDIVWIAFPDGSSEYGIWHTAPDGTATATSDDYHARPIDPTTATEVGIIELAEDLGTPPADGAPVADDLLDTTGPLHAECGACHHRLTAPAVWARGYPLHQHCADPDGPDDGRS